jgi:hypothetical protein
MTKNNKTFRQNVLADNAREYILETNQPAFGMADLLYVGLLAIVVATESKWRWTISCGMVAFWVWMKATVVKEERILCVRNVGVQVKTRYLTGRLRSQFIDCSKISDIIINEGINMLQVKFYLAIIVEGQDRMVVVFEHLLPRLNPVLLQVYRGARAILFNEAEHHEEDDGM